MAPVLDEAVQWDPSALGPTLFEPLVDMPLHISYTLRTHLTVLFNLLRSVERWVDPGTPEARREELRALLQRAEEACRHLYDITSRTRFLPHSASATPQPLDVHERLDAVLRLVEGEQVRTARLETEYAPMLPRVSGDEALLNQVFFTLLLDALQTVPPETPQRHVLTVRTQPHEGGVLVTLSASGPGLPPRVLPHLFEPLHPSWHTGSGAWLDLSLAKTFVEVMGGKLQVESQEGQGTAFSVFLSAGGQTLEEPDRLLSGIATLVGGDEARLRALQRAQRDTQRAFVACLARELMPPLHTLRSCLKKLTRFGESGHVRWMPMCIEAWRHSRDFVRDLLRQRYGPRRAPALVDVRVSLDAVLRDSLRGLEPPVRLETEHATGLPGVLAREGQLWLVFHSLIREALLAIRCGQPRQHVLRVRTRWEEGQVCVDISDTGDGFPSELLPHVRAPVFYRPDLHNPGFGLSLSESLLQTMGGQLRVESQEGQGTTVSVLLPGVLTPPFSPAR
ncbi:ATP-binding protein [Archangium gephyra]|uniref:ATP-binding protein n=1 Tax=Archangium gephyra TaxID=48 RepID=UPI0035D4A4AC